MDRCPAQRTTPGALRVVWCDWPCGLSHLAVARAQSVAAIGRLVTASCADTLLSSVGSVPATSLHPAMAWALDFPSARFGAASKLLPLRAGRPHDPQR